MFCPTTRNCYSPFTRGVPLLGVARKWIEPQGERHEAVLECANDFASGPPHSTMCSPATHQVLLANVKRQETAFAYFDREPRNAYECPALAGSGG